jgi:hypothetical protein
MKLERRDKKEYQNEEKVDLKGKRSGAERKLCLL